jgi:hypothetical protein
MMLMSRNELEPAPHGQGWRHPWPWGALPFDQTEGQFSHGVTTPEFLNQVGPFYVATSGPILHVHSQADLLPLEEEIWGTDALEVGKLRQLEEDNACAGCWRIPPRTMRCSRRSSEKALKPAGRREMVEFLRTCYQVSIRRASQTLSAPRATLNCRYRKPEQVPLRLRIKEIATIRYAMATGKVMLQFCCQRDGLLQFSILVIPT